MSSHIYTTFIVVNIWSTQPHQSTWEHAETQSGQFGNSSYVHKIRKMAIAEWGAGPSRLSFHMFPLLF